MTTQTQSPESRLVACEHLIRDAARHCGSRFRRELDFEDMVQEATIEVWRKLKDYPTAPIGYIWQVAYRAALHSLRRGKSVDRPITCGKIVYQVVSLEALIEGKDGRDTVEDALARRKRRGEIPKPTEEAAVARIMWQELWEYLTPRQRQVLDLRLQEYSEQEAATVLGISQAQAHRHVAAIRIKASAVWDGGPKKPGRAKLAPEEARDRRRERWRRKHKIWYAQHREEYNARRRARRSGP